MRKWWRSILWLSVALLIVGGGFLGWRAYQRTQPTYLLRAAQTALAAGQRGEAKVHLLNLVREHADFGDGHLLLARVMLDEASKPAKPATYANTPAAFHHLARAARYRPNDLKLQKQVLTIHLDAGRTRDAFEVAQRIYRHDATDPDVLMAYSLQAAVLYAETEKELARLQSSPGARGYRAMAVRAQLDVSSKNQGHLQQMLDESLDRAGASTPDDLAALSGREHDALVTLLLAGIREATDATTVVSRANKAMQVWEKLTAASPLPGARARVLGDAGDEATRLAMVTAQRFGRGQGKLAVPANDRAAIALPAEISARAEIVRQAAIECGQASALVYRYSAMAATEQGNIVRALELIDQGLALQEANRDEVELHILGGRLRLALRSREAEKHIRALLAETEPTVLGWGHVLAGNAALMDAQPQQALKHFLEARRRLGYGVEVRAGLTDTYLALGNWNAALTELSGLAAAATPTAHADDRALTIAARANQYIELSRMRAYWGQQAWDKVQTALDSLTKLNGTGADVFAAMTQSMLHVAAQQPDLAQEVSQQARANQPEAFLLVLNEVRVLIETGQQAEAERHAEKALKTHAETRHRLGVAELFNAAGQSEIARAWADRAVTAAKDDQNRLAAHAYASQLAMAEWRRDRSPAVLRELRDHLTAMLEIQPRNLVAGNNLSWLLATEFRQPEKAIEIAELVRNDQDSEGLPAEFVDTLALAYSRAGRIEEAHRILSAALTQHPDHSGLRQQLDLILAEQDELAMEQ